MSAYTDTKYSKVDVEGERKCCKCSKIKCCGICCGTFILVILLVIASYFIFLKITSDSIDIGDPDEWEAKLKNTKNTNIKQIQISGLYQMESYDENFEKYLSAMGVPWYIMPLILASKETIRVEHSDEGSEIPWNFTTTTAMNEKRMEWRLNEQTTEPYGRGPMSGEFQKFCTRPVYNIVNCTILEKERNWFLSLEMEWTKGGMISTREFINEHIVTKRFYTRVDENEDNMVDEEDADDGNDAEEDWSDAEEDGFDDFFDEVENDG